MAATGGISANKRNRFGNLFSEADSHRTDTCLRGTVCRLGSVRIASGAWSGLDTGIPGATPPPAA